MTHFGEKKKGGGDVMVLLRILSFKVSTSCVYVDE